LALNSSRANGRKVSGSRFFRSARIGPPPTIRPAGAIRSQHEEVRGMLDPYETVVACQIGQFNVAGLIPILQYRGLKFVGAADGDQFNGAALGLDDTSHLATGIAAADI
jgi:hypothetical protein